MQEHLEFLEILLMGTVKSADSKIGVFFYFLRNFAQKVKIVRNKRTSSPCVKA